MVGTIFLIFKGNAAIKGEQSFMCGTHCLDLRNIHFYKISSDCEVIRQIVICHMPVLKKRHYMAWPCSSKTLFEKRKFLLISINCQEKTP